MLKGGAAWGRVAGRLRLRQITEVQGTLGGGSSGQRLRASGGTESELEPSKPELKVSQRFGELDDGNLGAAGGKKLGREAVI